MASAIERRASEQVELIAGQMPATLERGAGQFGAARFIAEQTTTETSTAELEAVAT